VKPASKKLLPFKRIEGTPSEMSDEALVAAAATGEGAALGALFDRHHDAVRGFLARMAGTDDRDLDDLVQATFETVPRAARSFDGRSAVRTWMMGIACNVARHHVRSEIRRRRLSDAAAASPPPASGDATGDVLERERAARLAEAIAELPPKLREAFVLVYVEGVPGGEVATLLGVREGTIWNRLHEARAQLREALGGIRP
jgi:RNA polymerase sigma-70 factor (ECF subfamily)